MINRTKIIVDGKLISYFDSDSSAVLRPAIIFVHDNSQSLDSFHYQLTDLSLSTKYRLIALDLPGHGESDQLLTYNLKDMSSFFEQFIKGLNLDQYALMGHGLGMKIILASLKYLTPVGLTSWGFAPQSLEESCTTDLLITI
jgi:pimeloyl-ACP methyl ester carboxylesterase